MDEFAFTELNILKKLFIKYVLNRYKYRGGSGPFNGLSFLIPPPPYPYGWGYSHRSVAARIHVDAHIGEVGEQAVKQVAQEAAGLRQLHWLSLLLLLLTPRRLRWQAVRHRGAGDSGRGGWWYSIGVAEHGRSASYYHGTYYDRSAT